MNKGGSKLHSPSLVPRAVFAFQLGSHGWYNDDALLVRYPNPSRGVQQRSDNANETCPRSKFDDRPITEEGIVLLVPIS